MEEVTLLRQTNFRVTVILQCHNRKRSVMYAICD